MTSRFLGCKEIPGMGEGLLFAEASDGDLKAYIEKNNNSMDVSLRKRFCLQVTEAVAYIESRDVIHSDLRLEQYLVHATSRTSLDILLCDFGGSTCGVLGLDGGHLPEDPFFDPTQGDTSTPATDIFSLGSILYTILAGHLPHKPPGQFGLGEEDRYRTHVYQLFARGEFPEVTNLIAGSVVMGCWKKKYKTVKEILCALKSEMWINEVEVSTI
jgi:serine/threonine protein kinase